MKTLAELRRKTLHVDVALLSVGCAAVGCVRVVPPGDPVYFRPIPGTSVSEPLCAACGVAQLEDLRLAVRLRLHAERQRNIPTTAGDGGSPNPDDPNPAEAEGETT